MRTILNYLLFFFPSFINVPLRKLLGQEIGKGTKIRIGTLINCNNIKLGSNVNIGPLSFIKAQELQVGNNSSIKSLSSISTRLIKLGNYVHIAPLIIISSEFTEFSVIEIGDHSRLFPFCWLDTGNGIYIGENVGIGGHTLIFTHGVWSNYLDGAPVSYGPVKIKNNVWLPWRVFILPNVTIEENTIVSANSLVNKSFPKNVLIGGSPAKVLKENIFNQITNEEKINRFNSILSDYANYIRFKYKIEGLLHANHLEFNNNKIVVDNYDHLMKGDLLFIMNTEITTSKLNELLFNGISIINHKTKVVYLKDKNKVITNFISFIRRYGIRLYINK
jgi:acetyltransferase-like isoleucine patch superfamily enzyme